MTVKIHVRVAAALNAYRKKGLTDREIVEAVLASGDSEYGVLQYADFTEILSALTNGYEAKDEPEVAILKYYNRAKHASWEADEIDDERTVHAENARKEAVEFVLGELGVKVDGIN